MTGELRDKREEFLGCGLVQEFEREWVERYVKK
jgi:hypothetical protein